MAEALQKLILDSLDESGTIQDTRTLNIPGQRDLATSHEAQITILGALNSLLSREASLLAIRLPVLPDPLTYPADDFLRYPRDVLACPHT